MKRTVYILALIGLTLTPAIAGDYTFKSEPKQVAYSPPVDENPWAFELSPYFWFANLKGTVGVGGTNSDIDVGIDDIFDNLDFAFATSGGVRYKRVGLFADFMYLKITPSFETPGPAFGRTDLSLEQTLLDLKGTYRVVESDRGWLDLLVGARYMKMDLGLTLQPGLAALQSASGSESWWNAVAGVRARYDLSDRFFLTGLADVGGGSSDLTWQALGGVGYQITDRTHFTAGYRYMVDDYTKGGFKYDVKTRGAYIELGLTW